MVTALLGPQRLRPIVDEVLGHLGLAGHGALVTTGWLEREPEDEEIRTRLGLDVTNLRLFGRGGDLRRDAELAALAARRWHRVDELRRLYRRRLDHVLGAARELLREPGEAEVVLPERQSAIAAVRELDRHFADRLAELRAEELAAWDRHPQVERHRREVAENVAGAAFVLLAGGHVVELLDHLRLFRLDEMLASRPVVAWSAGAMALTDLVMGFHDRPPQGAGHAEVLDLGLGRCPGLVLLPHARRRLDLHDAHRVAILARRLAPAACLALDEGTWLHSDGEGWASPSSVRRLEPDGSVETLAAVGAAA